MIQVRIRDSNTQRLQPRQMAQCFRSRFAAGVVVIAVPAVELDAGDQSALGGGQAFGEEEVERVAFVEGEGVGCVDQVARLAVDLAARLKEGDG